MPKINCPANDPPKDVSTPLIGGDDTVEDKESGRPTMVRDHAERGIRVATPANLRICDFSGMLDYRQEQIGVVIRKDALKDGGDTL